MAVKTFNTRVKLKYDSNANWQPQDGEGLVLLAGEFAFDSTKKNFFIGNGTTGTKNLKYVIGEAIMADYADLSSGVTPAAITSSMSLNEALANLQGQIGTISSNSVTDVQIDDTSIVSNHVANLITEGTYNSSTNKIATESTVSGAIATLDGSITGAPGAGNTPTSFSQTDGVVTATFAPIAITRSQVTDGIGVDSVTVENHTPASGEFATKKLVVSTDNGTVDTSVDTLYFTKAISATDPIVVKSDLSGIVGAMVYKGTIDATHPLPDHPEKGEVWVVGADGTYDGRTAQTGDMFVYNGTTWDLIQGTVNVTNNGASMVAGGGAQTLATVEGTSITASTTVTAGTATVLGTADANGNRPLYTTVSQIANAGTVQTGAASVEIKKVAFTGAYSDLTGTPTVGSGTLSIIGGTDVAQTFSANEVNDKSISIIGGNNWISVGTSGEYIRINHDYLGNAAGTYASNTAGTLDFGDSVIVPTFTVDAAGHVTAASNITLTLPGEPAKPGAGEISFTAGNTTAQTFSANQTTGSNVSLNFVGYGPISVGASDNDITISHSNAPTGGTTAAIKIAVDQYGHVQAGSAITATDVAATAGNYGGTSSVSTVQGALNNLASAVGSISIGTLNTTNTAAQSTSSSESFSGTINLHKISKTANTDDLIQGMTLLLNCGTASTVTDVPA